MVKNAKSRYGWHKRTAFKRGIQFLLTFEEWYNWWLSNGIDKNLPTVPTNKNTLCMCRYNDVGPYELSNIYCATISQNSLDASYRIKQPTRPKKIKTPLGIFPSKISAANAYGLDSAAISYRMKKYPTEFYYI